MHLLICEEALHTLHGHWFAYVRVIAEGLRARGDTVTIAGHRRMDERIEQTLGARRVFAESAWEPGYKQGRGALGRLWKTWRHNADLEREVERLLGSVPAVDVVFAPTVTLDHVMAWRAVAARHPRIRFVLIFLNGLGVYDPARRDVVFPGGASAVLLRRAVQLFGPLVAAGRVALACETRDLADEFTALTGVPFTHVPSPVDTAIACRPAADRPPGEVVFGCLGYTRHEKGYDVLLEAMRRLRGTPAWSGMRFVIQWTDDIPLPDGTVCRAGDEWGSDDRVTLIRQPLTPVELEAVLRGVDALVLPYRRSSYFNRGSRFAIEAAMAGCPMVYTSHSWLETLVDECGAGVGFEDENPGGLAEALCAVASDFPAHQQAAQARAEQARACYSVDRFRRSVLHTGKAT